MYAIKKHPFLSQQIVELYNHDIKDICFMWLKVETQVSIGNLVWYEK